MALDATVMGSSSNSYATVAEADAYFGDRLGAESWNSIGDEIIDISTAVISGVFSLFDNQTEITVSGIPTLTPSLSSGDSIHILTDVAAVDGEHFITQISSDTSFKFIVSGDQSLISTISYLDRSTYSDKSKALVMATRYLDQMNFLGERTTTSQKLSFPRMFLPDPDSSSVYWGQALRLRTDYFNAYTIPDRILFATYELALKLLSDPEIAGDPTVRQFRSVSIDGVLSVVFNENALPRALDRNILNYLGPLLKSGNSLSVALQR